MITRYLDSNQGNKKKLQKAQSTSKKVMESKGVQNKRKHNVCGIKTKQNDMCYSNQLELKQSTTKCNIMWWIYFKQHNQRRINAKLLLRNICYGSAQSTQKAASNQKSNVSFMYYICLPEIQIKKKSLNDSTDMDYNPEQI